MKNKLFFALLCFASLLFCGCSKDETPSQGSIYGTITNSETGEPVRNAEIILSPGNTTTVSGSDGHYEFLGLEPGQYKVQVRANGYDSNSRQISVAVGSNSLCDILLTPAQSSAGISFSNTTVDFGTDYSSLRINIHNNGTSGAVSWNISGITEQWLKVSPMNGKVAMNGSETLSVSIDRSKISGNATSFFTIQAAGRAQTITVIVADGSSSGGNTGDDNTGGNTGDDNTGGNTGDDNTGGNTGDDNTGGNTGDDNTGGNTGDDNTGGNTGDDNTGGNTGGGKEDYSSASVSSCDQRISVDIINCKRSGSNVVFTYSLTNTGTTISDFRIYSVGPTTYTSVSDDMGHTYTYQDSRFLFGGTSPSGANIISTSLPTNAKKTGTITLSNVSTYAEKLYISIFCVAYPASSYNLEGNYITFSGVPIY